MRTNHYNKLHKAVSSRVLEEVSPDIRSVIAFDAEHVTDAYKWFEEKVNQIVEKQYNDTEYWKNDKYMWPYPQPGRNK